MKFFSLFLVVFLLIFVFVLPVTASAEMYMLSYTEWLSYYGLEHSDLNLVEWQSQFDGSNISSDYPIYIGADEYYVWYSANPADSSSNSSFVEPDLSVSDSPSESEEVSTMALDKGSNINSFSDPGASYALQNVPTSGISYVEPVLVKTTYVPDAEPGTLLSVLYSFLGKPVQSYTWRVQTSSDYNKTGYVTESLEYDSAWCASVILLLLFVYCLFKLGGGLVCKT